jgi:UDP-N-acetylmuramate--L-alanine ligase/undecaprenyldiphospho-muramoylpentapeptide beta-N-acetylglucosaminyltransferase
MTKILFAVGGTGGHIFPAQALASDLVSRDATNEILFVGGGLADNDFFTAEHINYKEVSYSPLSIKALLKCAYKITKGIIQSKKILRDFKPDIVIGFGSHHSFPALAAAQLLKIPVMLYESNSIPGRVNRLFSKYSVVTAITLGDIMGRLQGATTAVKMPLRQGCQRSEEERTKGYQYFGLENDKTTILVFGGSQGAKAINDKFRVAIEAMTHVEDIQVLHFVGKTSKPEEYQTFYKERHIPSCVKTFEKKMNLAWQVADIFIARAGATTLAEQEAFEVPGILIPYPYALDKHQDSNARFMAETVGGAMTLYEEQCTPNALEEAMRNTIIIKSFMRDNIAAFKEKDRRKDLADVVEDTVKKIKGENIHLIGVGGIGMSALAKILIKQGYNVTGSDVKKNAITNTLEDRGATISVGHNASALPDNASVVYSTAVKDDNPEYKAAIDKKYTIMHRSDMLLKLMKGYKTLAVAGTHGKTTNSALLTHVLITAQCSPSYAVGGILLNTGTNSDAGDGEYFVAEADESDGSFVKYSPHAAIITNIGAGDHLINSSSQDALDEAFITFAGKVSKSQNLYYSNDDERLRSLGISGITYAFDNDAHIKGSNYKQNGWESTFDITIDGKEYHNIMLPQAGKHNARNAMAIFAMALDLGINDATIRKAFETFKGVARRCEYKGTAAGVDVYDDYAHHPDEIKATLCAMKKALGTKPLIAVYQPHRYSRINETLHFFTDTFDAADKVIMTEIYSAGEKPVEGITSEAIAQKIQNNSTVPIHLLTRESLAEKITLLLSDGDTIVTLGAGDITYAGDETLKTLQDIPVECHI